MEALVALGLAANVAQFVAIAGKVVERTIELSMTKRSLLEENEELESIAKDFRDAVPEIERTDASSWGSDNSSLKQLTENAKSIAMDIEARLGVIRARRAKRKRHEKLFVTLKELQMRDDFDLLSERLSSLRDQISFRINLILLDHQRQIHVLLKGNSESNAVWKTAVQSRLDEILQTLRSSTVGVVSGPTEHDEMPWKGGFDLFRDFAVALQTWKPHMLDFQRTNTIISSLRFRKIEERKSAIVEAYSNTYEWIFDQKVVNFRSWLAQKDAGIYWIGGKAGSGKSTLMKYIHQSSQMAEALTAWARTNQLHIAGHFFWSSGTLLQKSQEGLLRTLLAQITSERPDLAPRMFPSRWESLQTQADLQLTEDWTTEELLNALSLLPQVLGSDHLFLFLDGLDEYDGEHDILIKLIKKVACKPSIKICVSSRPWLHFIDAFEQSPWKLHMQEFTRTDIEIFVRENLEEHSRFKDLRSTNQEGARDLVTRITSSAQGVFLWVHLVVKSLVRGLVYADSMRDLHRRLDTLPEQLEPFFDRMLDTIEPFYKPRTARAFLVLAHSRRSLPLISFYFTDHDEELPFEPNEFLKDWPVVNEAELALITTKKRQLVAQCKDMIHITEHSEEPPIFNHTVGFLHRTVTEYISRPAVTARLKAEAGGDFSPTMTLFEINTGMFGSMVHLMTRTYLKEILLDWLLASIYYAREVEVTMGITERNLDQAVDTFLDRAWLYTREPGNFGASVSMPGRGKYGRSMRSGPFLATAADCGLYIYTRSKLEQEPEDVKPTLLRALNPTICIYQASDFRDAEVTSEMSEGRRIPYPGVTSYTSTFEMCTSEELEVLRELQKQLRTNTASNPISPISAQLPQQLDQNCDTKGSAKTSAREPSRFKRLWKRLLQSKS
ncbi:hypothetical protein F4780DRAFT_46167 [Xylariomycetidae sp. FL0641]|nr:hypothetical protein F4780DRAFT_46167 [Xylariomycetidae sp. FL0641]